MRRLFFQVRKGLLHWRIGHRWATEENGFQLRSYPDYATYLEHQKTKFSALRSKSVMAHDRRFHAALSERLAASPEDWRGRSVLCLAARQGSEVRAFIDQGAFAVGIDLNPGPSSRFVVTGDFHNLQFGDRSIDCVYTNSLDHAFDLAKVMAEVRRVLLPGGLLVVEANTDSDTGAAGRGPYEAMVWDAAQSLMREIQKEGFSLVSETPFESPWRGRHFMLRLA